jgi:PQQ-dependent dehydrogenase (methanol/ethanol family)
VSNRARLVGAGALLLSLAITGCKPATDKVAIATAANVDQQRQLKGTDDPHQWPHYGGSYSEQRFSPLRAINSGNVKDLGLAWYGDYDTNQDQHGSPLYVDGVIYVSTARNVVHAFDAKTGKRIWTYNPVITGPRLRFNIGLVNKGIAAYDGKIYMGTIDARLVALDARTGKEVWSTNVVPAGTSEEMSVRYTLSMAPRVAKGKVFIGASGGEYGVRGWIGAFDAATGREVWRFWTVPGDPAKGFEGKHLEAAAKTWPSDIEYWKQGGGGTVWDAAVYDPATDLLYFGTGNGTPWNREMRDPGDGDNLYVASIIAVKADTGEYVWHYQETPGDTWDYDAVSPMMTADLTIDGVKKHVLIQPSKNGFLYVLEAATGKLISADAFTGVTWASGVDLKTGRPIEIPGSRYESESWNVGPGAPGGHTWHPNAYSPDTGLVYIPTWENYNPMSPQARPPAGTAPPLIAMGARDVNRATLKPHNKGGDVGNLKAWDPVARKVVWETPQAPRATSGVLATGGNLVFMGNSGGRQLSAYDAKTGAQLWSFDTQTAIYAAPITYELDGVQYVAASVGGVARGADYYAPTYARMLVFALDGKAKLPPNQPYTPMALNPPPSTASADVIRTGSEKYEANCATCHGANATQQRGNAFPNLTVSPLLHSQPAFDQVVLQGIRAERGMGNFSKELTAPDAVAVREFLIARANELKNRPPAPPAGFGPAPGAGTGNAGGAGTAPAQPTQAPARDIHEDAASQR